MEYVLGGVPVQSSGPETALRKESRTWRAMKVALRLGGWGSGGLSELELPSSRVEG